MDRKEIIELLTSDKVRRYIEIADGVFISGKVIKEIGEILEQESFAACEDTISRKEAEARIDEALKHIFVDNKGIGKKILSDLSPVMPVRPKAYWILHRDMMGNKYGECSNCHKIQYAGSLNYCPYCGYDTKDSEWHHD